MITVLALISFILALVVVLVAAWHLLGIYLALRKGRAHLAALAGGLTQIRDDTAPLTAQLASVNGGLSAVAPPWLAANANLAAIVAVASGK